jgi:RimJ/RimL family protein N-acetyltransferase
MINTKRLTLRPLNPDDWSFVTTLYNQPDFIEHIGDKQVKSQAETVQYLLDGPMKMQAKFGFSLMAIALHSGECIGVCGLLKRDDLPLPDLGYALLAKYYKQGFAFEAANAILDFYSHIPEILAITSPTNVASQQLLIKLGFTEIPPFSGSDEKKTTTFKFNR